MEFNAILSNLLSEDNTTRKTAEEQLNTLSLSAKLPYLVSTMGNAGVAISSRDLAAVLLRRALLQSPDELSQVDPTVTASCRSQLLQIIQSESNTSLRHKICDTIAELARASIDENDVNHWPQLLTFLFECCDTTKPELYQNALHIIRVVPAVFGVQLNSVLELVSQMFYQAMISSHQALAEEAVTATSSFIISLEVPGVRQRMNDLLPHMISVLEQNIQSQSDDTVLKSFIDLAEHRPKFLRPELVKLLELMAKLMQAEVEDNWKQLSLEFVVTFAENGAAMLRKLDKFHSLIIELCLNFMVQIEDDDDWNTADELANDDDSSSMTVSGETALDRLANALGGKAVLPHIISIIPKMLTSADWKHRYGALMAVSAIAEGCEKQMTPILNDVITCVLPYCQDSHPRVRYAACNALGQMSSDFSPTIQEKFHDKIIPSLLPILDDFKNPRVLTHAGAALVNFCELCPKSVLSNYLSAIIPKLEASFKFGLSELVDKGRKIIIEQMVTTLATVADAAEELFAPYYPLFMPNLKHLMSNAVNKEHRLLRGKTIECISFIGLAVGKEMFMQDAHEILDCLFKVQSEQNTWEPDDPQASYMISAWARICKIIGPEFVAYLPFVVQPLIQAASIKPEIAIVDSIDAEQNYSEDDGWEFITLADQQKFGIKTAGLDDKCTAMQMLVVYAKDLKEGFIDYAEPVSKIMVPHLRFYFHELVRAAAAEIIPHLLECIQSKGPDAVAAMWSYISEKLLEAIPLEPDSEITGIMISSLCKCIELLGLNCFTTEQYTKIVDIINDQIETCFLKLKKRHDKRLDEDYDEEVEDELEAEDEEDDNIMRKIADLMHSLFMTHGSALLPFFDQLLPTFTNMLSSDKPSSYRQWSLCVFDDLLDFASESAIKYQSHFLQPMLDSICNHYPPTRQAAAYGIGIMAVNCSKDFINVFEGALSSLIVSVQGATEVDMPTIHAKDNAISAVAKICRHIDGIALDTVLPLWLSWLPVVEDKEEASHVYTYLCDLIERNNASILGANNENVPKILGIIGDVISEEVLTNNDLVLQRLLAIARHVQASDVWDSCLQYLSKRQQVALTNALR
ncbi:PREDICTED: importin-5 [Amphimedon queenslandica]|uniref:TOG domain-containing protein n=1 Tax=Amphimedon queenslandica TaxID=400682 RepID=A0A1X7UIQ8_AMPQE|nr:PREDICTED: importin-5 [Amphimedon queenslandica]|eukprot:XP_011405014.2 PREDICTED: importin-5 [Amphimedon queenslandica]